MPMFNPISRYLSQASLVPIADAAGAWFGLGGAPSPPAFRLGFAKAGIIEAVICKYAYCERRKIDYP